MWTGRSHPLLIGWLELRIESDLVVCAGLCTAGLAVLPPRLGLASIFLAGMWLAPSWATVLRFFEGRAHMEVITGFVSLSYIAMSGVAKAAGTALLGAGMSEGGMVAACAALGVVFGGVAALALAAQPPPSHADVLLRGRRVHLANVRDGGLRLLRLHGLGLALAVCGYTVIGALRAYRDVFQAELFASAGAGGDSMAFAATEGAIAAIVVSTIACFSLVRDNWTALNAILVTTVVGAVVVVASTAAHMAGALQSAVAWTFFVGAGAFVCYAPTSTVLLDRFMGAAAEESTTTLLSLVADSAVLVATFVLMAWVDVTAAAAPAGDPDAAVAALFARLSAGLGTAAAALMALAGLALNRSIRLARRRRSKAASSPPEAPAAAGVAHRA